jgi:Xaa-Pro aminopeptidase
MIAMPTGRRAPQHVGFYNLTAHPVVAAPKAVPAHPAVAFGRVTPAGVPSPSFPPFGPPPFNPGFHRDRRAAFLATLPANSTVVVMGGSEIRRNNDVNYPFRQQNDFYYLTGFDEPNAVAVLSNVPGQPTFTLFVPPKDPSKEVWTGRRAGPEGARQTYGATAAFDNTALAEALPPLLNGAERLYLVAEEPTDPDQPAEGASEATVKLQAALRAARPDVPLESATPMVRELRLIKTPYEIALLRRAAEISARAHRLTMRSQRLTPEQQAQRPERALGRNEGEIQAKVEYHFRKHGAVRVGYPSISGAAANGCVLHYVTNSEYAQPGDLVLLDAGAEYGHYTADVTRTWPVSGRFTPEQKALYNVVLAAQEAGIAAAVPGSSLSQIHQVAVRKVTEGLVRLGLLQGEVDTLIAQKAHLPFFMHGTSHFLGMDVHDTSGANLTREQGKNRPLAPGMAITVEPGIYIDPAMGRQRGLDPKWWGIGIRIEDDILITDGPPENLSAGAPKTVEAIEALMARR